MTTTANQRGYDLSTSPSLGRGRRRIASWLGLLVLAFNVLGASAMPARGESSPLALALGEGRMVVCTATGMVVLNADGTPAESGIPAHDSLCAYCLPLMHGAAAAPALLFIPAISAAASVHVPPPGPSVPLAARRLGAWTARAPPAL